MKPEFEEISEVAQKLIRQLDKAATELHAFEDTTRLKLLDLGDRVKRLESKASGSIGEGKETGVRERYQICYQIKGDDGFHDFVGSNASPIEALKEFIESISYVHNISIHKEVFCGSGDAIQKMEEQK